jgi:hypothetical protein
MKNISVGTGVTKEVLIRYSYEWKDEFGISDIDKTSTPLIETSRPFCKYLLTADKMYTRSDIERMSARLGYSVWDRCGGDDCRHRWVSNIVTRR